MERKFPKFITTRKIRRVNSERFFILAKWIFGAFIGGVLISFVETKIFSYKTILDSLDFFIYIIPIIVAYYFYNKLG